jgi:hypothetical protein
MIQRQIKIEGTLAGCPGCGKQPKHYHVLGRDQHLLECYPCGLRTAKMPTLQQAIELWEAQDTARFAVRA